MKAHASCKFKFKVTVMAMMLMGSLASQVQAQGAAWQPPEPLRVSDAIFSEPHDIALSPDGLYLFVADKGHNAVEIVVPGSLEPIGQLGSGTFASPHDIAFDKRGRVYVADTGNGRISVWKFDGVTKYAGVLAEFVEEWSDGIEKPTSIALSTGGRAYVTDVHANALLVIDNGVVTQRVTRIDGVALDHPHDVGVGSDGSIYLTDPGNDRIVILNPDLSLNRILDKTTHGFEAPKYLGLDGDDMLFVADKTNDRIRMLSGGGEFIHTGDIDGSIATDGLNGPKGFAVDGRYIWVSDTRNNRIILLRRKPR